MEEAGNNNSRALHIYREERKGRVPLRDPSGKKKNRRDKTARPLDIRRPDGEKQGVVLKTYYLQTNVRKENPRGGRGICASPQTTYAAGGIPEKKSGASFARPAKNGKRTRELNFP